MVHVDDERFRNGSYEFRARAVDYAGNEASTGRRSDGSAATLRLPARIDTRLAVGVPRMVVRRKLQRRRGQKRRLVKRRIRRLDSTVVAPNGRAVQLAGFLSNADGQPIEGATIEALEQRPGGRLSRRSCYDRDQREVSLCRQSAPEPRHALSLWRFPTHRVRNDRFHPVRSGTYVDRAIRTAPSEWPAGWFQRTSDDAPLADAAKLVEMQAYFRGRWRTFSTLAPPRGGTWRFPYRFGGTVGPRDLPVSRPGACRGRLPLHHR